MGGIETAIISFILDQIGNDVSKSVKDFLSMLLGKSEGNRVRSSLNGKCWYDGRRSCNSKYAPLCPQSCKKNLTLEDFENCPHRSKK